MLRNSKTKIYIGSFCSLLIGCVTLIFLTFFSDGTRFDYQTNDFFYSAFSGNLISMPKSDQIVYLTITDDTYKHYFKKNSFNRRLFADALHKLSAYQPQAVLIDIIFAYPDNSRDDNSLAKAFSSNDVYLPISFSINLKDVNDVTNTPILREELIYQHLKKSKHLNGFNNFQAGRSIVQLEKFILNAKGVGHISDFSDNDGIVRHSFLMIQVDSLFLPALYLEAFLDYQEVPFDSLTINVDNQLVIPAVSGSWLNEDVKIPIDEFGRTRIPFADNWLNDFPMLSLIKFMELVEDNANAGALTKFFEGKFVIVGDVSTGIADLASTSVDKSAPLVTIQANMLNALLKNKFINKWSSENNLYLLLSLIILLSISALFEKPKIFYFTFLSLFVLMIMFYIIQMINFQYISMITILSGYLGFTGCVIAIIEIITSKAKREIETDNIRRTLEMEEARKIQLSMLPQQMPDIKDLKIAAYLSTATEVGGDYYDFYFDEEKRLRIIIGDATGHGLKAGTMVTIIKTLFSTFREFDDLKMMLNKMSAIIKGFQLSQLFICLAVFHYESKKIKFTSAGMPPVIIYRKNSGTTEMITLKGLPLGIWNDFPYETAEFDLNKDDVVLLTSDGLMELFNKNDEMLGLERIEEIFLTNAENDPEQIIDIFVNVINDWTDGIEANDDITILVIRCQI